MLVGLGGLGCAILPYLAASGIGHLILADPGEISLSDLHRQVLYGADDVGRLKVEVAKARAEALHPGTRITTLAAPVGADSSGRLGGADLLIDATDNHAARSGLNRLALTTRLPLIAGAVIRFEGWVARFATEASPPGPCYRCFMGEDVPPGDRCAELGVLGPAAGVIGSLMAVEAIKALLGIGESLAGRVIFADLLHGSFSETRLARDPVCPACGRMAG